MLSVSPVGLQNERHGRAGATLCQRIANCAKAADRQHSMQAARVRAGPVKQLCQGLFVETIGGVAELTVDLYFTALLGQQGERILTTQTDQGIAGTFRRTAAAEAHRPAVEQAHILLVIQTMQYGAVV